MTDTKDGHFVYLVQSVDGYLADAFVSQTNAVSVNKIHMLGNIFGWRSQHERPTQQILTFWFVASNSTGIETSASGPVDGSVSLNCKNELESYN